LNCSLYRIVSKCFVKKQGLEYILVFLITVKRFLEEIKIVIKEVVVVQLDIDNISKKVFFYILEKLEESYNLILRVLWFKRNLVILKVVEVRIRVRLY